MSGTTQSSGNAASSTTTGGTLPGVVPAAGGALLLPPSIQNSINVSPGTDRRPFACSLPVCQTGGTNRTTRKFKFPSHPYASPNFGRYSKVELVAVTVEIITFTIPVLFHFGIIGTKSTCPTTVDEANMLTSLSTVVSNQLTLQQTSRDLDIPAGLEINLNVNPVGFGHPRFLIQSTTYPTPNHPIPASTPLNAGRLFFVLEFTGVGPIVGARGASITAYNPMPDEGLPDADDDETDDGQE